MLEVEWDARIYFWSATNSGGNTKLVSDVWNPIPDVGEEGFRRMGKAIFEDKVNYSRLVSHISFSA